MDQIFIPIVGIRKWYNMFFRMKIEECMESKLSDIFRVKLVAKNIVLGSQGIHFMHIIYLHRKLLQRGFCKTKKKQSCLKYLL